MRGHDPASRRIIEDEAVEEERAGAGAGAGDPTDPQLPKVAVPGIRNAICKLLLVGSSPFAAIGSLIRWLLREGMAFAIKAEVRDLRAKLQAATATPGPVTHLQES
jgi:hypothetical protein